MRHAQELARSGKYADLRALEEDLQHGDRYAIASALLQDGAIRYQLTLLCEKARMHAAKFIHLHQPRRGAPRFATGNRQNGAGATTWRGTLGCFRSLAVRA